MLLCFFIVSWIFCCYSHNLQYPQGVRVLLCSPCQKVLVGVKNPISKESAMTRQVNLSKFVRVSCPFGCLKFLLWVKLHSKMMLEVLTLSTSQCDLTCTQSLCRPQFEVISVVSKPVQNHSQWPVKNMPAMQKLQSLIPRSG